MMRALRVALCTALYGLTAALSFAQSKPPIDVDTVTLEELLATEVVSTASKFPQEIREAPASITIVTAEEIRRHGHRTLSEVLRSVRGLYTTYDRNYSYIGIRGFARPGDYNTRVLLLVDGHRLNDGIYDMAPIGTDFPVDVSLIDKVEIIRGPGSSLYGTSAFFAIVNVITRTGAQLKGLGVETSVGSQKSHGGGASFGRLFSNQTELLVAGSVHRSSGADRLHFPEFEWMPGGGVAVGLDDDESTSVFGSLSAGRLSLRGAVTSRHKQVPTASFDTVFGDGREATTDTRAFLSAVYDGPLARGWSATARLGFDYYGYRGIYPFDYGEEMGTVLWDDTADSRALTGEFTVRRRIARSHLFTAGVELRDQFRSHQQARDVFGTITDVNEPRAIFGVYAQDEVRVFPWLLGNVGVRVDRYPTYGSYTTPRAGLVLLPRQQTSIKMLYGQAFRAPNAYELYYFEPMRELAFTLAPERTHSTELVWEEQISKRVRMAIAGFVYHAHHIIEQRALDSGDLYYANGGAVEGRGVEGELEARLAGGFSARVSHAAVRTEDGETGTRFWNSPRHLSKVSVQIPVSDFCVAVEGQYVGERLTITGEPLGGYFVPNVTLTSPAGRRLEVTASLYNAFDRSYADPGAEEHVQRSIPQDGRTFLVRLRARF